MKEPKQRKNAITTKPEPDGATTSGSGLVVDICGSTEGLNRHLVRRWSKMILRHLGLKRAELSLAFVTDPTIQSLNCHYRSKDKATDVLSFPLADKMYPFLMGDVVVSTDTARRQAIRRKQKFDVVIRRLLIHGILHLVGYDHEISRSEAVRMGKKEREVRTLFGKLAR